MNAFLKSTSNFLRDEEGAQIIEYALLVAVVSLGLILAFNTGLITTTFPAWLTRVGTCLSGGSCAVAAGG
jgi:pilus assembly protein Flp/PilA